MGMFTDHNKFQRNDIVVAILTDQSTMKLEIKNKYICIHM